MMSRPRTTHARAKGLLAAAIGGTFLLLLVAAVPGSATVSASASAKTSCKDGVGQASYSASASGNLTDVGAEYWAAGNAKAGGSAAKSNDSKSWPATTAKASGIVFAQVPPGTTVRAHAEASATAPGQSSYKSADSSVTCGSTAGRFIVEIYPELIQGGLPDAPAPNGDQIVQDGCSGEGLTVDEILDDVVTCVAGSA